MSNRRDLALRANHLPKEYRALGREALEHGFVIVQTKGGHLAWRAPNGGGVYHTAVTPSDRRSVRNVRSGLEKLGLPKRARS